MEVSKARYAGEEMSFSRRTFLVGAGSGLTLLAVAACTPDTPTPQPTLSLPPTNGVPSPTRMVRSAWSTDTYALGTHSFTSVGASPQSREALAEPLLDRVFFAGEATAVDNPATVLGARASALRVVASVRAAAEPGDKIAVIGAGAAGAEAARALTADGFDVVLIEARDRVGGRIHTAVSDNWPVPVEFGAWLLREESDASVIGRLASAGLGAAAITPSLLRSTTADAADLTENTVGPPALDTALAWATQQSAESSLADSLVESGAEKTAMDVAPDGEALLDAYVARLSLDTGAEAADLSSWYFAPEAAALAETRVAVTGGMSALIEKSLEGVETFLSTTVVGINYDDDGVSLRLGSGESLTVDRAIVTVPLGVLKGGGIEFDPLLPFTHRAAISDLGFGAVETLWLRFEEPFWTTEATAWTLLGTDDVVTQWLNLMPITGEPILVGFVGGDGAAAFTELDDTALTQAAMESLAPFVG